MRGKVVSRIISEARREAKMTKSRALNFALNSQPVLTILVVIRSQHIGFRLSNHLKQSTWRVLLLAVSVDIQLWEFGTFWRVLVRSQNIICTDPTMTSRLGNIQWRLLDFARTFNYSFPNLLCLPFAFVDIFVDTFILCLPFAFVDVFVDIAFFFSLFCDCHLHLSMCLSTYIFIYFFTQSGILVCVTCKEKFWLA